MKQTLLARASLDTIMEKTTQLETEDIRWMLQHLADVAALNGDVEGLELMMQALGIHESKPALPHLQALLVEAMAAGKENAMRKVAIEFDPEGRCIQIPGGLYSHEKPE